MKAILEPIKAQQLLIKKGIKLFSSLDLQRFFNTSRNTTEKFIARYCKKKLIIKVRKGFYYFSTYKPSEFEIANKIYQPSYISFDTALSYYGIIPETIYSITSATTAITRLFIVNNIRYSYQKVKKEAYQGYKPIKIGESIVLMAEPEKALADYLYFVALKKRQLYYERLELKKIKKRKILLYAKLFKYPALNDLIKKLYVNQRKSK